MYNIEYEKGDSLYLYTDGITELFGGKNTEKLKISGFRKILQKADSASAEEREQIIKDGIDEWRGELGLNDDILIIGLQF
jgi:serine phosphatase RsbU (regulator of sigma subunit)